MFTLGLQCYRGALGFVVLQVTPCHLNTSLGDELESVVASAQVRSGAFKQGTPEWYAARCGKITASCFGKIMTAGRSKTAIWGQTALSYMLEVMGERLTGKPEDQIASKYLDWGNQHEPSARSLYAWITGRPVQLVPFIDHPTVHGVGGSPDGLVGEDGVLEIKCPFTTKVHLETILENEVVDKDYMWQCQGNLWVTGRKWLDFVSFHPDMPNSLKLHIVRVNRDDKAISELEKRIELFSTQLAVDLAKIRATVTNSDMEGGSDE